MENTIVTYNQHIGADTIEYRKILNKKKISDEEWEMMVKGSNCWETCPVSQLPLAIPRDEYGKPEDSLLALLGNDDTFSRALVLRQPQVALAYLDSIQARGLEVLKELYKAKDTEAKETFKRLKEEAKAKYISLNEEANAIRDIIYDIIEL